MGFCEAKYSGREEAEGRVTRMVSEAQKRASAKWDAENTVQIKLKLHKTNDRDIIEKLKSVGNKQGYIKQLIRGDIAKGGDVK